MMAMTVVTGVATLHGSNLMDTPYGAPDGLLSWLDVAGLPAGASFTQSSPGRYRAGGWDDWEAEPRAWAYRSWPTSSAGTCRRSCRS